MTKLNSSFLSFLFALVILTACSSKDEFLIAKNSVGVINSATTVQEIDALFENDSVVKHLSEGILGYQGRYAQEDDKYLIYSKEGEHLLTLTPKETLDSLSTIKYIDIHSALYTTENGIGLGATFEEINFLEHISKTDGTFTKIILYLDQLNATITLNKTDLGITTLSTNEIQLEQIPNLAKPASFVIWFD